MRLNYLFLLLTFSTTLLTSQHLQKDSIAFFHGTRSQKALALTFDACPSSVRGGYDSAAIKVLIDSSVSATLFMSGKWMLKHRATVKKLAAYPQFELANHSFSHPHCTVLASDSLQHELQTTENLFLKYVGKSPRLFRPPFGETDNQMEQTVHSLGLATIMYDVASGDPDSTLDPKQLIHFIERSIRPGSIVVLHMNGRGWHTAEILPQLIGDLRKKGYRFKKVSEFLVDLQKQK